LANGPAAGWSDGYWEQPGDFANGLDDLLDYVDDFISNTCKIPPNFTFAAFGAVAKATRFSRALNEIKHEGLIYRQGSRSAGNLTPKMKDLGTGLSGNTSLGTARPGKNQVIDPSKFKNLCAVCDGPGHVSIRPKDMSQMRDWVNSRGGPNVHPFTQEVEQAIVGEAKK